MPDKPTQIQASVTKIKPVQIIPEQDVLLVIPAKSSTIQYHIAKLVPGSPEIIGSVGKGKTLDEKGNVIIPAIQGYPTIPATPDRYIVVESGSLEMDQTEWDAWQNQDDDAYRSSVVLKRLGLSVQK